MRKIRYFLFTLFASCAVASVSAQNNVIDEVIWVVGDEAILKSDVEQARLEALNSGQRLDGDPYCVIPEQLAVQKLFLQQAAIDSVEVSDADVFQEVENKMNDFVQRIGSKEKVEEYFGKTSTQIREYLFEAVKTQETIREVQKSLMKDVKVTPAQVRRYVKEVPEDSLPFIPTQLEVQLLVRQPVISPAEVNRVKEQLRTFTEQVNSGQRTFAQLAQLYSEDRMSAQRGGELGFTPRSQLVPEFATAAFNLTDPKTISKIVETEYGYHIIQLIEKRGDRVNARHILMRPKVSDDELVACLSQMDSIMDVVKKGDISFEDAITLTSEDKDTRANYGIMVNKADMYSSLYGTSKFELKDLPAEVAKAVAGMQVGDISKPFIMVNQQGKEVVAVAKLRNRINGHRATMKEDYQTLQNVLTEKLSEEKVDNWIREMQKKTYIHINEGWGNCEFKYPGWVKE